MDPITAVGAVASIITLAQTALSLSKALYTLGSAVQSASEDIEALADDLKTFSQSLNLLSRLLEDSKSWYSDDVYLLTAKIIKDCADLYEKIDKILVKLGGNGKNTWKIRMKFVYKEGQIRKLMKRLRDMKGNLATVLMSLQVDLQLSLLNISSSSKIQRSPEKELESETIRHLKAAQSAVESCNFLPKYSSESDRNSNDEKILQAKEVVKPQRPGSFAPLNDAHSFIALPENHERSEPAAQLVCKSTSGPLFAKLNPADQAKVDKSDSQSLRSVSSTESFKSAVSIQKELLDLAQEVKAVKSILHAFRIALETLENLIQRRIPERDECYPAARHLKILLVEGQKQVQDTHLVHCETLGTHYAEKCNDSSTKLHDISFHIMRAVVTSLHMLSAEHEVLNADGFVALHEVCEKCSQETVDALHEVAHLASGPQSIIPHPATTMSAMSAKPKTQAPDLALPFIGYTFKRFESNYNPPIPDYTRIPDPEDPEDPELHFIIKGPLQETQTEPSLNAVSKSPVPVADSYLNGLTDASQNHSTTPRLGRRTRPLSAEQRENARMVRKKRPFPILDREGSSHSSGHISSIGSGRYEDKIREATGYQDDVGGPSIPLTAEVLKRNQRRQAVSSRSTKSSASLDESDYRKSATTRTTRSGGNAEDATIKATGTTRVRVGDAYIECLDGEEIQIKRQSTRIRSEHSINSTDQNKAMGNVSTEGGIPPPSLGYGPSNMFGGIRSDPLPMPTPISTPVALKSPLSPDNMNPSLPNVTPSRHDFSTQERIRREAPEMSLPSSSSGVMDSLLEKLRAAAPQGEGHLRDRSRARLPNPEQVWVASGQKISAANNESEEELPSSERDRQSRVREKSDELRKLRQQRREKVSTGVLSPNSIAALLLQTQKHSEPGIVSLGENAKILIQAPTTLKRSNKKGLSLARPTPDIPTGTYHSQPFIRQYTDLFPAATGVSSEQVVRTPSETTDLAASSIEKDNTPELSTLRANLCSYIPDTLELEHGPEKDSESDLENDVEAKTGLDALRVAEEQDGIRANSLTANSTFGRQQSQSVQQDQSVQQLAEALQQQQALAFQQHNPQYNMQQQQQRLSQQQQARQMMQDSVIRPYEYEDVVSDHESVRGPELDHNIYLGIPNMQFQCENDLEAETGYETQKEAWLQKMREEKRRKSRSSGSVQKRTLSQSIGSDTDDEDIQPATFEGATSARRLRRKVGRLIFDDPPLRIEELEEPQSCEVVDVLPDGLPGQNGMQLSQAQYQAVQNSQQTRAQPLQQIAQHMMMQQYDNSRRHSEIRVPTTPSDPVQQNTRIQELIEQQTARQLLDGAELAKTKQAVVRADVTRLSDFSGKPLHSPVCSLTSPGIESSFDSVQPIDDNIELELGGYNFDRHEVDDDQKDVETRENTEHAYPGHQDKNMYANSAQSLPPDTPMFGTGLRLNSRIGGQSSAISLETEDGDNQEVQKHSSTSPSPILQNRKIKEKKNDDENQRKRTPNSIKNPEETPSTLFYPLGDLQQVQVQDTTLKSSGTKGNLVSGASPGHEKFNESFRQQQDALVSKSGLLLDENLDLWSNTYESMRSSNDMGYIILSIEMETLDLETRPHSQTAKELSKLVQDMPTILNYDPKFADVLSNRDNIIAILKMVDKQLGFELALVGWSCVWKLLSNHEELLGSENENPLSTLKTTYAQILEITGLIARYAVMENLYRNSPTMTLKPEYTSSLCHLCLTMLFYFSSAFELRRAQLTEVKTNGGMNEAVFNEDHKSGLEQQLQWRCGALLDEIRVADDLCRGFKVVVDVKEDSESEMSGEEWSDGS